MNTNDSPVIAIVTRMKFRNTVSKHITTLAGITRKLLIGKADHNISWDQKKVVDRESRSQL